jgi:NADP-dependent aldehyde dehydrogenase
LNTVTAAVRAAAEAAPQLDEMGRRPRAALLDQIADALEEARPRIVETGDRESHLGAARMNGELSRTCFQLRLFGDVLREGSYLEATLDSAGTTPAGPRPDLRRMLIPVGPVAVFGASNFPLAFGVGGGDTASALAAGCPVVAKIHPAQPETSALVHETMNRAITDAGLPPGAFGVVEGFDAGIALVAEPGIRAVGFTGSVAGGRALHDIAASRPEPIPFYGELGSVNPLVVTPGAATARAEDIATGYAASLTLGAGQFCTKPGMLFLPAGPDGDDLRERLRQAIGTSSAAPMLTTDIHDRLVASLNQRMGDDRVRELGAGSATDVSEARPAVFTVAARNLADDLLEETFGPLALIVEYTTVDDLTEALARVSGQLTATLHAEADEAKFVDQLHTVLRDRAGRLVFDGYPTGVAVAWAMQHGGPYPAATSPHTSVGPTAIRRWLRPIAYQNAPDYVLPPELRDGNPDGIPRRVDGTLQAP